MRKLELEVSDVVLRVLEELVATGMHGHTIEQAAEELLREKLREIAGPDRPHRGAPAKDATKQRAANTRWRASARGRGKQEKPLRQRDIGSQLLHATSDAQAPPAPPFCTSGALGTSAPSVLPRARAVHHAEGASQQQKLEPAAELRGLAVALAASPFRERLPRKYRERAIAVAVTSLHASRITAAELQELIEIAKARGRNPWGLLAEWIDRGGACCRQVLDEQRMKRGDAAGRERGRAPAPADAAARGEGSTAGEGPAYGTEPRLASSFVPQLLQGRANGEGP